MKQILQNIMRWLLAVLLISFIFLPSRENINVKEYSKQEKFLYQLKWNQNIIFKIKQKFEMNGEDEIIVLQKVDYKQQKILWEKNFHKVISSNKIALNISPSQKEILLMLEEQLYLLDLQSGKVKWSIVKNDFDTICTNYYCVLQNEDLILFFGSENHQTIIKAVSHSNGKQVWLKNLGSGDVIRQTYLNSQHFIFDTDFMNLYVLSLQDGKESLLKSIWGSFFVNDVNSLWYMNEKGLNQLDLQNSKSELIYSSELLQTSDEIQDFRSYNLLLYYQSYKTLDIFLLAYEVNKFEIIAIDKTDKTIKWKFDLEQNEPIQWGENKLGLYQLKEVQKQKDTKVVPLLLKNKETLYLDLQNGKSKGQ